MAKFAPPLSYPYNEGLTAKACNTMNINERKTIDATANDIEEVADMEIEEVPITSDNNDYLDVPDDAEEDDTTENVSVYDDEWDDEKPNALKRLGRSIRRKKEKVQVASKARSMRMKERLSSYPWYQRIMSTSRWHWICGAIVILSTYDFTLFFFGDKSYDIIFPKAEPIDGAYTEEKPRLIQPEVEEYEAKKPDLDKAERESQDNLSLDLAPNELEDTPEDMPTSVAPEVTPAEKDIPSSHEIKSTPAPKIEAPAVPAE